MQTQAPNHGNRHGGKMASLLLLPWISFSPSPSLLFLIIFHKKLKNNCRWIPLESENGSPRVPTSSFLRATSGSGLLSRSSGRVLVMSAAATVKTSRSMLTPTAILNVRLVELLHPCWLLEGSGMNLILPADLFFLVC